MQDLVLLAVGLVWLGAPPALRSVARIRAARGAAASSVAWIAFVACATALSLKLTASFLAAARVVVFVAAPVNQASPSPDVARATWIAMAVGLAVGIALAIRAFSPGTERRGLAMSIVALAVAVPLAGAGIRGVSAWTTPQAGATVLAGESSMEQACGSTTRRGDHTRSVRCDSNVPHVATGGKTGRVVQQVDDLVVHARGAAPLQLRRVCQVSREVGGGPLEGFDAPACTVEVGAPEAPPTGIVALRGHDAIELQVPIAVRFEANANLWLVTRASDDGSAAPLALAFEGTRLARVGGELDRAMFAPPAAPPGPLGLAIAALGAAGLVLAYVTLRSTARAGLATRLVAVLLVATTTLPVLATWVVCACQRDASAWYPPPPPRERPEPAKP